MSRCDLKYRLATRPTSAGASYAAATTPTPTVRARGAKGRPIPIASSLPLKARSQKTMMVTLKTYGSTISVLERIVSSTFPMNCQKRSGLKPKQSQYSRDFSNLGWIDPISVKSSTEFMIRWCATISPYQPSNVAVSNTSSAQPTPSTTCTASV